MQIELNNALLALFTKANKKFTTDQSRLVLSGVSERCLCASLSCYLQNEISKSKYSEYYVDVEYNRNGGKVKTIINAEMEVISVTCDLIIHSRGEKQKDNLLAIEMKKSTQPKKNKLDDKARLMALTKHTFTDVWSYDGKTFPEHVCDYDLGIYYEINIKRRMILLEYYIDGNLFGNSSFLF